MDDRTDDIGRGGRAHGGAPYPRPPGRASRALAPLWALVFLLAALPASPARAASGREIRPDGKWQSFEIQAPGQAETRLFEVVAGCRYRVTAEGRTLERLLLEVGTGEVALWSADSKPTPAPGEPAPAAATNPGPPTAAVTWDAERDDVLVLRVQGFSVLTGKGRVRLETLDAKDEPTTPHRRVLAPGGTLARVGALWVDEANTWDLDVRPGQAYVVRTRPGTSDRLELRVLDPEGRTVACARPGPGEPYPTLGFEVPQRTSETGEVLALRLEVRAVDGAGGTYGVRLEEAPAPHPFLGARTEPEPASEPPALVERGLVEGRPLVFRANPGDLAVLYLPTSSPYDPHLLQVAEPPRWQTLSDESVSLWGRRASMRTPENAALVWFRPHRPGTFRFVEPRAQGVVLKVYPAEVSRGGPLLLGTGLDPTVGGRGEKGWRTVGVGVCMPGWPYLFVAVSRRRTAVSLRVRTLDDEALAYRPATGAALSHVAGLGPSLRFRVKEPTLVLLQVRGKGWEGNALLRRAAN